jgi:IclR family transcriptional regulator, acetate operon repressor
MADPVEAADGRRHRDTPAGQPVKSAVRTVELLEHLARHRGLHGLIELQDALGYPKSSLYVLLRTLVDLGWVETDPTQTRYRIGVRALLVGTSYIDGDDVVAVARDTLDWLAAETTETVHLARLDGSDVVYLATRESQHYLRPFSRVGRRLPAHSTSLGKALLADRDVRELNEVLPATLERLTPHTITGRGQLLAELEQTRRRGYAVDREENTVGLRCTAVALRYQHPARDAISCSVPTARMAPGRQRTIAEALAYARERIEEAVRDIRGPA